jgi:hypothetical protein
MAETNKMREEIRELVRIVAKTRADGRDPSSVFYTVSIPEE